MSDPAAAPEYSDDEIYRLVRQVLAEQQSVPTPASVPTQPQSISGPDVTRELSLDEILQKIQRAIADE
jgi:hypothetical protein